MEVDLETGDLREATRRDRGVAGGAEAVEQRHGQLGARERLDHGAVAERQNGEALTPRAILLQNVGVMGKLWAESIEAIDYGPVDAMRVGGASRTQVVSHAVVPAVTPQFVGLLLYRFDVNVRSSLVLGLVGAGGIGFLINESIKLFRFDEMLTHIIVVLVLVVVVDNFSALVRKRIQ